MSFIIKDNSRKILPVLLFTYPSNCGMIRFGTQFIAGQGAWRIIFQNGGDNKTFGPRVSRSASCIWPIWNNLRSFLIYLKKLKKSIKSYFDSKEVKSDRLLLACYTVMSSFQSCYFLNCSSHYVDSEILSCIFAPCLVYGFIIALNVYVSHHFYLSSVQVSVFVKESYIRF